MSVSTLTDTRTAPAHRTQDFYAAFNETGPGTLGGKYLRQFWHAVALSADLKPGTAKPVTVLSETFTLYRGQTGTLHMTVQRCPHRGTQLSVGYVEDDAIRCLYHGWKFGADGVCLERPAESGGCSHIKLRTYPVQEYLGLVFAYLGDDEPPVFPPYPSFAREGIIENDAQLFECGYFQGFENDWDLYHAAWTHKTGELHGPVAPEARHSFYEALNSTAVYEEVDYGVVRTIKAPNNVDIVSTYTLPATIRLVIPSFNEISRQGKGPQMREAIIIHTPIDDHAHMAFLAMLVPVVGEEAAEYQVAADKAYQVKAANPSAESVGRDILAGRSSIQDHRNHPFLVAIEDIATQCGQGSIADRHQEMLGRSDAGVVFLRRLVARELGILADGGKTKAWSVMPRPPVLETKVF